MWDVRWVISSPVAFAERVSEYAILVARGLGFARMPGQSLRNAGSAETFAKVAPETVYIVRPQGEVALRDWVAWP